MRKVLRFVRSREYLVAFRLGLLSLLLALAMTAPAFAELWADSAVTVTDTSQTITFPRAMNMVIVVASSSNTIDVYYRLFDCTDTPGDATVASTRPKLEPGTSFSYPQALSDPRSATVRGWCAISLVVSSGTAEVQLQAQ